MQVDSHEDGPALGRGLASKTWALFVGLALLLAGAGLIGSLVGVRAELAGFPTVASGLIGSAYYAGFLVGSALALRALGRVGHVRVFAALAALGSASVLTLGLAVYPIVWIFIRLITGLCMAGLYVVAESWLNGLANNEIRGRLFAVYMVVTSAAFGAGQLALGFGDPGKLTLFALAAIFFSLAVAPVALAEGGGPVIETSENVSLRELAGIVPTGVFAALIVGIAHGALGGMGAVYATRVGLPPGRVAIFMAVQMLGGVVLQWPISAASDDINRRFVALGVSVAATGAAVHLVFVRPGSPLSFLVLTALGGLSYPLYSLAVAYTNDWTPAEKQMAAASRLVFLYGVGALVGPLVASVAMSIVGAVGFFWSVATVHFGLAVFLVYRMTVWRSPIIERPWSEVSLPARAFYLPATLVSTGRRLQTRRRTPKST
jgi:MFS family permease